MSTMTTAHVAQVKLVSKQEVAERTMAFHFEKPADWIFEAGQCLDMTLLNPFETDAEGNIRTFSIASSPEEGTLMVATRMRDTAFKRVLNSLPLGTSVRIEGPSGDLILDTNASRTAVFLAGGIGITPFRSMAVHAAREKLAQRIFLFYSNHAPEDAPFLVELQALEAQNPNFKLIATMTDMAKSLQVWPGETGPINGEMLQKHLTNGVSPIYYVAGPPEMVKALHSMLLATGVGEDSIRAEEFAGY